MQAADGSTALHMASYVGAISLMELLLMNGADPDVRDCDGRLPIHWATKPLSTKPLSLLLKVDHNGISEKWNTIPTCIKYDMDVCEEH